MIVTTGIVLLFWGVNFLKGKDFFSSDKLVYAIYNDVEGLAPSNPVMVSGMRVGLIRNLKLIEDNSGRIIVSMHVTNKVHLPKNSTAQIFSTDILGSKGIKIILGKGPDELQNGDTLLSDIQKSLPEEVSSQVAPLKAKAESILSSMDSVLIIIRDVFNERTKNNLRHSFESISGSLASIENIVGNMDTIMSSDGRMKKIFLNLESISSNLKNNNEKISTIIDNFAAISDTIARSNIAQTLNRTQKALEETANLMTKVNQGEGTLGQLATNDSLYVNLNATARDLDKLMNDFKENPERYVKFSLISFGKKK